MRNAACSAPSATELAPCAIDKPRWSTCTRRSAAAGRRRRLPGASRRNGFGLGRCVQPRPRAPAWPGLRGPFDRGAQRLDPRAVDTEVLAPETRGGADVDHAFVGREPELAVVDKLQHGRLELHVKITR